MARKALEVSIGSVYKEDRRIIQESDPYTKFNEKIYSNANIINEAMTNIRVEKGKRLEIDSIVINTDIDETILIAVQILTSNISNPDTQTNNIIGTRSGDAAQIDYRATVSKNQPFVLNGNGKIILYDKTDMVIGTRNTGLTGISGRIHFSAVGRYYDLDSNHESEFVIQGVGDSIMSALNGGTDYYDDMIYLSRIRDFYRYNKVISDVFIQGQSVRKVNRGKGGRTSVHGESWRRDGYYTMQNIDLCVYNFMTNDGSLDGFSDSPINTINNPITQTTIDNWKANVTKFINWFQSVYYGKTLVIVSATPATSDTLEANLVELREAGNELVSNLPGNIVGTIEDTLSIAVDCENGKGRVIYVDLTDVFDRKDIQFYNNSQSNGDGLHPNAVRGHAAVFNDRIKPALEQWLPKL